MVRAESSGYRRLSRSGCTYGPAQNSCGCRDVRDPIPRQPEDCYDRSTGEELPPTDIDPVLVVYTSDAFIPEWIDSLEKLAALDFDITLPGHGAPFKGSSRSGLSSHT